MLSRYTRVKETGVQWLGKVPAHWVVAPVKRHYLIQLGKMLQPRPNAPGDRKVRYLKAKNVQWGDVDFADIDTMYANTDEIDRYGVGVGDLLACEGGEGGRCAIVTSMDDSSPCIIQNALHRVRVRSKTGEAHGCNKYLRYVLTAVSSVGWFRALNDKAIIAHFTAEKFGALPVPMPSPSEQSAIVRFLDYTISRIERYFRAKEKLSALLEEQKRTVIYQAVTGQADVHTGRPYSAYKESGVDWVENVPRHWATRRLGAVGRVFNGSTPSRSQSAYWVDGIVPWLNSSKVNDGVVLKPSEYVTHRALRECSIALVPAGAVIVGLVGQGRTRGLAALLGIGTTISQNLAAVIPGDSLEGPFLRYLLSAQYKHLREAGRGGNQEALNCDLISRLRVHIPPKVEQEAIIKHLDRLLATLRRTEERIERQIALAKDYRLRLIADVVTGKLDVRGAVAGLGKQTAIEGIGERGASAGPHSHISKCHTSVEATS